VKKYSELIAFFSVFLIFTNCGDNNYSEGKRLYEKLCQNCHQENGLGLGGLYPPLAHSDYLINNQNILPRIIKFGLKDTITVNGKVYDFQAMEGFGSLTPFQINNIICYINTNWGNQIPLPNIQNTIKSIETYKK
jgi:mono/diheme cytochrome c family protein